MATGISDHASALVHNYNDVLIIKICPAVLELGKFTARGPLLFFTEYIYSCYITKTSPCNEHPLTSHFYKVKLGFQGVYFFFLFLLQNIDCGYSLEPPQ